jgi:hypothetical protein
VTASAILGLPATERHRQRGKGLGVGTSGAVLPLDHGVRNVGDEIAIGSVRLDRRAMLLV